MGNITSFPALSFFKADRYTLGKSYTFDARNAPRPHFCMGFVLFGEAMVTDCRSGEKIEIRSGNIIFVPMNSTYVAEWRGNPEVEYISLHFVFDMPGVFSRCHGFSLCCVKVSDPDAMRRRFEYILNNYTDGDVGALLSQGELCSILSEVLPQLPKEESKTDKRALLAMEYVERSYKENFTVEDMAGSAQMSVSRFYPYFKRVVGETPVDYINRVRIGRAIVLMYDKSLTIEEISSECGFNSSIYFRRVFKKLTGKTPREYIRTSLKM